MIFPERDLNGPSIDTSKMQNSPVASRQVFRDSFLQGLWALGRKVASSGPWVDAPLWALAGVRSGVETPEKTCSLMWT